jgi:hypothetical protein
MYKRVHPYDPQFVADCMEIERACGYSFAVGSKLAWPKPLPRTAASAKAKAAAASPKSRKKRSASAA